MVRVVVEQQEGQTLETAVEDDIRKFEEWFRSKGNDPLVRSEVAILKTWCWWKLKGAEDGTQVRGGDSVLEVRPDGASAGSPVVPGGG